jgi:hypothetical protein
VLVSALDVLTVGHAAERGAGSGEIPPGYTIVEGDILVRDRDLTDFIQGTYEVNFWTNGIVPYTFTTNSGNTVDDYASDDISFVAGNPPEIRCATCNWWTEGFTDGEEILVSGSASNDNSAGNGYTIARIAAGPLMILSPGDPIVDEAAGNWVSIKSTWSVSPMNQALVIAAMAEWEAAASIDFVPLNNQPNYINIQNFRENRSVVGMEGYGEQTVYIQDWGEYAKHHELGHALGFYHEHQRPDRDDFVQINWGNITGGSNAFTRVDSLTATADAYPIGAGVAIYDFDSVMHYSQCAYSNCASCIAAPTVCRTITVLPPNDVVWQYAIGQSTHLSYWDKKVMSFLYPENNWVFLHASSTAGSPNGTFLTPYTVWSTAYAAVPSNGRLIIMYPDTYSAAGTYSKAMTIEAPVGGVVLR